MGLTIIFFLIDIPSTVCSLINNFIGIGKKELYYYAKKDLPIFDRTTYSHQQSN